MREREIHEDRVSLPASAAVRRVASMQGHGSAFLSLITVVPDRHVPITVIGGAVSLAPSGGLLESAPQTCLQLSQ